MGVVGLRAQEEQGWQEANAAFDHDYAVGLEALRAGNTSQAWRAFARARGRVDAMAPERRAMAAFVAGLFLAETKWRAGQVADASVHAELLALAEQARASGAWTAARWELYRLRAIVLLWRTAPMGSADRGLGEADREWLLREDFFAVTPGAKDLHDEARVLRLRLALGSARELARLRDLMAAEQRFAARVGRGDELLPDEVEHRTSILGELANYHAERRSFDRARIYAERMPAAKSVALRGWLALQREDHSQAIALGREMLATDEVLGHQLLAEALEAGGEPAKALEHYVAVLGSVEGAAARAAALNGRGDCLLGLDRFEEAREAYAEALGLCDDSSIGLLAERAEIEKDLGRLAERGGDASAGLAHYLASLRIGEAARARLLRDPFGGSWLRIHGDQGTAIDGVLRTWQAGGGDPWRVLHALELGRARSALDLATGGGGAVDAEQLRAVLTRRLLATDAAEAEAAAADLDALRASSASRAAPGEVPVPGELRAFVAARPGAVLLWWLGREQAWLLVANEGGLTQFALPPPPECRRHVGAAFRAVASPAGDPAALAAAADCLLPAAARPLCGEDVLAVVDPTMARLPLAALDLDGEPLGVRVRLWQAPSLAVARLLAGRRGGGASALVVQAPERTELTDHLGLDPLGFVGEEAAAVARAHPFSHVLADESATVPAIRASFGGSGTVGLHASAAPWDVLHIAAHAVDCPGLPTQSLLLLADGPLAMGGLPALGTRGTLVVLSSCAAAVGEQRGHEGVVGLVEGAFAAGARGAVAPVAPVNQQATAAFMRLFHGELGRGADAATALRAARRAMAAEADYAHPHYWGSFALFGAPGSPRAPTPVENLDARWLWGALVAVLLALGFWLLRPATARAASRRRP